MRKHIAILDDERILLTSLKALLSSQGYAVSTAETPGELESILQQGAPDLFILDYYLKEGKGPEVLEKLRKEYGIQSPAIIMTGLPSFQTFEDSQLSQADRFLPKPIQPQTLLSIVKQLESHPKEEREEEVTVFRPLAFLIHYIREEKVHPHRFLVLADAHEVLKALETSSLEEKKKMVNFLLLSFYYHLQDEVGPANIESAVSEYGSDVILTIPLPKEKEDAVKKAIRKAFQAMEKEAPPLPLENWSDYLSVKVENLVIEEGEKVRPAIIRALRKARPLSRIELSSTVFQPFLQGIWSVQMNGFSGYELLSRPQTEYTTDRFYEIVTRLNLHSEVDARNIEVAHRLIPKLPEDGFLSINLIPLSLHQKGFLEFLVHYLGEDSHRIVLELTERCPHLLHTHTLEEVEKLKKLGFRIALDDVGSGYSNITSMMKIRPDMIKLDRMLVHNLAKDAFRSTAVKALCDMAQSIGATVCAEGVEDEKDWEALKFLPITYAQGYLLHKPERAKEVFKRREAYGIHS